MLGFVNSSRDFAKQNSADALSHRGSFKVDGAPRDSMLDTVDESDCRLEHSHFCTHARMQKKNEGSMQKMKLKMTNAFNQRSIKCT